MMVGNPMAHVSGCPKVLYSPILTLPGSSSNCLPQLPLRSQRKPARIRATSADTGHSHPPSNVKTKNPFSLVLDVPQTIWRQTLRPLNDFGFSRKSIWEGGVGLFLVSGTVLIAFSLSWLRGYQMRHKFQKYQAVFEFAQACGISIGTPVRIRVVNVGNVIRINPSLKSIEAVVEVDDDKTVIPRNSLIEVNQSGLLMETLIEITPHNPIPTPSVGPLDPKCSEEGLIVCDCKKIKGNQGVSLDELVGIFTRLGREVEDIALMSQIKALTEDVQPLLAEVRDSGLLQDVDKLTRSLTESCEELRRVHSSIMTPENTSLIQDSIQTLLFTLKNIENICSDIQGFMGDEATKQNLKALVRSLSRLM
ncbi:protein trigalactosyldiacylglycerol 2 [Quercus suber]|uniref:Protein trigalactosyldiacylglycerol 2 n=1 Tax=Quercus suber TaxID=58331 RepID=A0AAW0J0L4_QUESU